jgi:hypothetical protein
VGVNGRGLKYHTAAEQLMCLFADVIVKRRNALTQPTSRLMTLHTMCGFMLLPVRKDETGLTVVVQMVADFVSSEMPWRARKSHMVMVMYALCQKKELGRGLTGAAFQMLIRLGAKDRNGAAMIDDWIEADRYRDTRSSPRSLRGRPTKNS